VAAYFTHREEEPKGNAKAKLYDRMAGQVDMRIATCRLYAEPLSAYGPTIQVAAPLERDHFVIGKQDFSNRQASKNTGGPSSGSAAIPMRIDARARTWPRN